MRANASMQSSPVCARHVPFVPVSESLERPEAVRTLLPGHAAGWIAIADNGNCREG